MLRKLFSSQLRINMVSGVATTMLNILVLAVGYPIYLHFLGYEQYGLWLILTTVLTFAQLGNLGIGRALTKLVAEEYERRDLDGVQQYVTAAVTVLLLSGAIVLGAIIAFREPIVSLFRLSDENEKVVRWLLPYVGCLSVYVFLVQAINSTLSGLGRMDLANWTQSLGRVVAVTVSAFLLWCGRGIESLLIGSTLSYMLVHIISVISIRRSIAAPLLRLPRWRGGYFLRLLSFGMPLVGGSILNMLIGPFNKLMLARYIGVAAVPVYEIASRGSMQIRGLIEAGLRALMPEISRAGASMTIQARERISQLNARAMRLLFCLGVPAYAGLILIASPFLRLWLGTRFLEILPGVLRIMLVGTFFSVLCVPAYYTLMGLGRIRQCFLSHVIQGVVNAGVVGAGLLFAGTLSIWSVAFAVALAMGATSFYVIWESRRVMKRFHYSAVRRDAGSVGGMMPSSASQANSRCSLPEDDYDATSTLRYHPIPGRSI